MNHFCHELPPKSFDGLAIRQEVAPIAVEVVVIDRFGWHWGWHVKKKIHVGQEAGMEDGGVTIVGELADTQQCWMV